MQDNSNLSLDEKSFDLALTRRLMLYIRPHWKDFSLAAALLLLITVGEMIQPKLIQRMIDGPVRQGDPAGVLPLVGAYALSMIWVFLLQTWQTIQTKGMGQNIMLDMRDELFSKIHAQPLRYFDKNPVGALM